MDLFNRSGQYLRIVIEFFGLFFFAKIKKNCLNLLNLLGGLWSFIKHFVWFLNNFGVMAAGQSPPGQPGSTIQPLKPDREIPGGGGSTG